MKHINQNIQSLAQKKAEVEFRRLMSQQHKGLKSYFSTEYNDTEMRAELAKRLDNTRRDFAHLTHHAVTYDSFLEIGAEYGLRSSLLCSEFGASGIALDIARDPLISAPYFAKKFKLHNTPQLICADAHTLPFADNAFSFIFCYQTLHHFPDPLPVIAEIIRVLRPGGWFFFAEEPIKQTVNARLFRRPTKQTHFYKLLKYSLLLPFISQIGKHEVDYGIVEETFPLNTWSMILQQFDNGFGELSIFPLRTKTSFSWKNSRPTIQLPLHKKTLLHLLGGGIAACCQKKLIHHNPPTSQNLFRCPDCRSPVGKTLRCIGCKRIFSQQKKVTMLLPKNIAEQLYAR